MVPLLAAAAFAAEPAPARSIPDFTLRDTNGKEVSLADFRASKLVVIAFLGVDCPLVKLYGPRLEAMSKQYAERSVAFLGINSNRQDRPRQVGAYARQYGITFPILKDPDNSIADLFAAERTPELFVLDEKRVVRYRGRVDDQYGLKSGSGYGRPSLTRSDLAEAIDELLAGKPVSVPQTEASGCIIGRIPKQEPHGDVTYANQISRIFQKHCVECHRKGDIGPFPMTSYDEVLGWGEMIREVVAERRMPPWYANPEYGKFRNERRLTAEEQELIARWVANGQPLGNKAELPEPRVFVEGWQIPHPDAVIYAAAKPYPVAADGVIDLVYLSVDPGFTEDKWVKAAQVRPGNPAVVHHIIVSVLPPTEQGPSSAFRRQGNFVGYAPGQVARIYPEGQAYCIPAGSKLSFELHYTPIGVPAEDRSSIGLVFCDPKEVKFVSEGSYCGTMTFKIPAGASDYVIKAKQKMYDDVLMTGMYPHTHLRGTSFRFEVDYPDGAHEVLLDVPRYDFNWQLWYELAEPKLLPKGSVLRTTAHYDNSADNVFNPDPNSDVRYGLQTWEEMMFGWYSTVVPREKYEARKLPPPPEPVKIAQ